MNKLKFLSLVFLTATAVGQAQDLDSAYKAIDGEQFDKAKQLLKALIASKPTNGKADFLLGNIYLTQKKSDSAKIYFQKGLGTSEYANYNSIGLGQMDLDNGDVASAKSKFDAVMKDMKKKDLEQYIYIAKAYMNSEKPDYKSALSILNIAKEKNPTDAQVQMALGDANFGDKNQNDAYAAYRNAYTTDGSLIRAKMQLGVLLKGAKAYDKAIASFNEILATNSNYGPAYREMAETYYYWGKNQPSTYADNIQKALSSYEKYMQLTDYSLDSRMRHADFLILANDYKDLEVEANKMKELDKVNPRILRYLGYAAYENGNTDAAISALTDYTTKGNNKIIGGDYFYLGLAKARKAVGADGKLDQAIFNDGIASIKQGLAIDPTMTNPLNDLGKKLFTQKLYGAAATVFEMATANTESKNYLEDNVYYGLSVYSDNRGKDAKTIDKVAMDKADKAMDNVIAASPSYQEAYLYKARINSAVEKDDAMVANYQKYIDMVVAKGADEVTKNKTKIAEGYNSIAANFANTDKAKAVETFNKTLAIDPTNAYALESLKKLK